VLLPPATLTQLGVSPSNQATLLGKQFFTNLISSPFLDGLHVVFYLSATLCVIGAVASLLRAQRYIHDDTMVPVMQGTVGSGATENGIAGGQLRRGESPMITILTMVEVLPGREADFEELWRGVRRQQKRYPGLRTERLLHNTDQRGGYVVYSEWEDREQYDAFIRASGMLWLLDATDHWMTPPTWSYLEDVEETAPTP
jgi:quinol monooxygenase YgiN